MKRNKLKDETGSLVISLDFELLWGIFDKIDYRKTNNYFLKTRDAIPKILQLFEKYDVHCTWAVVGMLLNTNWDEWEENMPNLIPDYENKELSAYKFGNQIKDKKTEELCFAPDLIKMIMEFPSQELATHTYSHYYCKEKGQNLESFEADLKMASLISNTKFGVNLKSMVFPRNQMNAKYLEVCGNNGLQSVRSNPDVWYWRDTQKDLLFQKIFRTGDAYIGLNNKPYSHSSIREINNVKLQPASRLLRPYSERKYLNQLKINRILKEMTYAAKNGKIYHLWWHPHNFGDNPDRSLKDLECVLNHFSKCRKEYGFSSRTMDELNAKH